MSTIRYGIIGSGMMGQEHMRSIALLDGARVTAIADPNAEMRHRAASLSDEDCAVFDDHRDLIAAGLCDAVVVAAPNYIHHRILLDLLPLDLPILVEKPLGIDSAECDDILRAAAGRRAPVWVAMEYRYMPPIARLLDEVRSGRAGTPHMIAIREHRFPFLGKVDNWNRFQNQTGGTLVEKCCHFFDLMRLVAGSEAVRVYASGGRDVNFLDEVHDGRQSDILDNAFVIVDFANGVRAMLDLCMFAEGSQWQETVSVTGDVARIDAFGPGPARFAPDRRERPSRIGIATRANRVETFEDIHVDPAILAVGDHHGSTYFQHEKFLQAMRTGGKVEIGLEDGALAVAIGAAAEESVRTRLPVLLEEKVTDSIRNIA
jgi:predicted dehydrogenase